MPIDPSIPLSVQPIQIQPPIQSIGAIMQAKNLMSEVALRGAQTEQAKQEALDLKAQSDQRNRDLADANTAQEWMKDPANAYAFGQGKLDSLAGKVQPKTLKTLQDMALDSITKHATNEKSQLELSRERQQAVQNGLDGLTTLPDNGARAAAWPGLVSQWKSLGYLKDVPPGTVPEAITGDPNEINQMAAKLGVLKGLTDAALARKKETATTRESSATAALKEAETPGAAAKSTIEQTQADAMKNLTPQSIAQQVDQELNPANYPDPKIAAEVRREAAIAKVAAEGARAQGYGAVQAAIKDSVDRIGRLSTGVASAAATVPSKIQVMAGGDEFKQRQAARSEYLKSSEALNQAQESAANLQTTVDAARVGNKVAYAYAPVEGVLTLNTAQGVKRVNMAEIKSMAGGGSDLDRIEGWLGKHLTGESVPPDILKGMEDLNNRVHVNAVTKHNANVKSINGTYQTNFPAEPIPGGASSSGYIKGHIYGGLEFLGGDPLDKASWRSAK